MFNFPTPENWNAVSRDESIVCDDARKRITFSSGPFANSYTIKFDTLIGDQQVIVTSANKAILLHKASLFGDNEAFAKITAAKQTKKMLEIAGTIAGYDAQKWKNAEYSIVKQVLHEKFLQDLWMFDTLCMTGDYDFNEVSSGEMVVPAELNNRVLKELRDLLRPQAPLVRSAIQTPCHVVNTHFAKCDVDISRSSIYGNENKITDEQPREVVLAKYRSDLKRKIRSGEITRENLIALAGKRLGCTCMPNDCHGDILNAAVKWVLTDELAKAV